MSSYRKRGNRHQFRITVDGDTTTKTFIDKTAGEEWAVRTQRMKKLGHFAMLEEASKLTFRQALDRYEDEFTPDKDGARQEASRIKILRELPLAQKSLTELMRKLPHQAVVLGNSDLFARELGGIIGERHCCARRCTLESGIPGRSPPVPSAGFRTTPDPLHGASRMRCSAGLIHITYLPPAYPYS